MSQGQFEGVFEFPIKEYTLGYVANFTFNVPMKNLQVNWQHLLVTFSWFVVCLYNSAAYFCIWFVYDS